MYAVAVGRLKVQRGRCERKERTKLRAQQELSSRANTKPTLRFAMIPLLAHILPTLHYTTLFYTTQQHTRNTLPKHDMRSRSRQLSRTGSVTSTWTAKNSRTRSNQCETLRVKRATSTKTAQQGGPRSNHLRPTRVATCYRHDVTKATTYLHSLTAIPLLWDNSHRFIYPYKLRMSFNLLHGYFFKCIFTCHAVQC